MRETPTLYKPCYIRVSEGLFLFAWGLDNGPRICYNRRLSMYEVYSIDTKIINIDRSHNLEKRTKAPLRLHRAVSLATKLERKGHVTMIEKVSPAA